MTQPIILTGGAGTPPLPDRAAWSARGAFMAALAVWCVIASIFGAQLYLPPNRSIANPMVNALVPAFKDGLWLALVCFSLFVARQAKTAGMPVLGRRFVIVAGVALLALALQLVASSCANDCGSLPFPLLKNVLLYSLGGLLVGYVTANLRLEVEALRAVLAALIAGLAASIAVFAFFEFEFKLLDWRHDFTPPLLRMYGTMGNPNSVGWAAVMALPLILLGAKLGLGHGPLQFAALVLAFVAIYCSASFSALVGCVVTLAVFAILQAWAGEQARIAIKRTGAAAAAAFVLALALAPLATPGYTLELVLRVKKLTNTGPEESVEVRAKALAQAAAQLHSPRRLLLGNAGTPTEFRQYDSIWLTLFANFGAIGLALFMVPWLYAAWLLRRVVREAPGDMLTLAFAPVLVSLLLVNAPLQPQLQLFPLNFFAFFLLGLWVTATLRRLEGQS
jgi:hypothetical protein